MSKKQIKIIAIIYDKKGRILSVGQNSYVKTHPIQYEFSKKYNDQKMFLHAEIDAIVKCKNIEKAHRIEILRYMKNEKKYVKILPCPICNDAIQKLTNIKIIDTD